MAGNMHLKPSEKERLAVLANEHPAFKGMKESEIVHHLLTEAFGNIAKESKIDWTKSAKALKESVGNSDIDKSVKLSLDRELAVAY